MQNDRRFAVIDLRVLVDRRARLGYILRHFAVHFEYDVHQCLDTAQMRVGTARDRTFTADDAGDLQQIGIGAVESEKVCIADGARAWLIVEDTQSLFGERIQRLVCNAARIVVCRGAVAAENCEQIAGAHQRALCLHAGIIDVGGKLCI